MCTVSFVNAGGKIIITSNRDEQVLRPAIPPSKYVVQDKNLIFPKDPKAGGTWYAVDEQANVLVLLNGAAEKHKHLPPYRRSRGLIVLDLLGSDSAIKSWADIDLENVEPFTLVLFFGKKLYQLRWDGSEKSTVSLNENQNHVWSSSTLYPKDVRERRAAWFSTFLDTKPEVTEKDMLHFHRYTESEDTEYGLVINRNDLLKTLSITQAVIDQNTLSLTYADLINNEQLSNSYPII
ncbi:MAG: hypothetical protein CFE23_15345 [Flavobacterium sp. BFFFF1]|uniref:NRDE family protein n=1 Tax=Flavobacterium sp. BFFFF1 TaxID=2015557 RepID=UPI000BD37BD0|nr:NRDE family protein [Flavobacterium sp. BFFFF1]OYU79169.1 MAG: hypothetical protein CFE23_15345 [Flavobacterium sp. BFFFF1]